MPISFNQIPSNLRVPLFYAEVDNSLGGYYTQNLRALLVGQSDTTLSGAGLNATLITSEAQAKNLYGPGSILARMVKAYFDNNSLNEMWVLPFNDAGGSTAATRALAFTGTATENGTIHLYIAGEKVAVGITNGDVQNTIASKVNTAIGLLTDLPVTAAVVTNTVTLTAKNAGTLANEIYVSFNLNRDEVTPAGVTLPANGYMASGATDPTISFSALGDEPFEYFGFPYTDTTSLNTFQSFLDSRWNYDKMLYGVGFSAKNETVAGLTTFGAARNDEHISVFGYLDGTPTWLVDVVGMAVGQAASSLSIDPARTLQTLPLNGFEVPASTVQPTLLEKNTLLNNGVATVSFRDISTARIERAITTYQKNAFAQADPSFLDVETLATLARIIREMSYVITQKFPRSKLAKDGTVFGAGQDILTPKTIKAEVIGLYDRLISLGLCQNLDGFVLALIVEIDATDPNRVNVLLPVFLVNNLRIFATKVQFRLTF